MTELYAVKHVADRVANEPRNVGVIAATGRGADSRVATRFLGVDLDGASVRRPLPGVPKNIYLAWVNYFRVKTRESRWEDIARARRRRPQDFYLDHVLTILDSDDVERIADEYLRSEHHGKKNLRRRRTDIILCRTAENEGEHRIRGRRSMYCITFYSALSDRGATQKAEGYERRSVVREDGMHDARMRYTRRFGRYGAAVRGCARRRDEA